jgi:N-acetyl-anhydromuramyl-L-alanine amidase AmpD
MEAAMVGRSLPVYLYGIHDPGPWRERFRAAGVTGWVIFEETIGADPEDLSGRGSIYQEWADAGFGVIVVLNHGRYPNGTLPSSDRYEAFARRCARFVAASPGAHIWIIGNEPNHPQQQPGARLDPRGAVCEAAEWITPERYARCFQRCREQIRNQPGHEEDWVIPAAVAPFTAILRYPGNPTGDWIVYFHDLITALGEDLDGIALHVAGQSADPQALTGDLRCPPPYEARRWGFRAYQDFIEAIPPHLRHLPLFITEASIGDQGGRPIPWPDADTGWISEAYAEIHRWNADPAHPPIRCMALYRWQRVDPWFMEGKAGLLRDLDRALTARLRWDVGLQRYPRITLRMETPLRDRPEGEPIGRALPTGQAAFAVERTEDGRWVALLLPDQGRWGWAPREALTLQGDPQEIPVRRDGPVRLTLRRATALRLAPSPTAPALAELPAGSRGVAELTTSDRRWWRVRWEGGAGWVHALDVALEGDPGRVLTAPHPWTDADLQRLNLSLEWIEPLLPRRKPSPWPRRPLEGVRYLILHPLEIPGDLPPQTLADFLIERQGRPGFPYHFYLTADGRVFWTLPLEAMTDHAGGCGRISVGIAITGWREGQPLAPAQLDRAARLCAWLGIRFRLGPAQIRTIDELFPSAGAVPLSGAAVREATQQILKETGLPIPGLPEPGWRDLPSRSPFPPRPLWGIRELVLHHTGTDPAVPAEQIVAFQVERLGLPGPTYHFLVAGDGTLYRIHPLTAAVSHAGADPTRSVSIGLIGDFRRQPPKEGQLTATAELIAFLLEHLGLGIEAVKGHEELDGTPCPGGWRTGIAWRGLLWAQVQAIRRRHGLAV